MPLTTFATKANACLMILIVWEHNMKAAHAFKIGVEVPLECQWTYIISNRISIGILKNL